ncbi:MAG: hypothetical protein ACP5N2_01260 [Candidatus Nanoarchaeia archaeon]
MAKKKAKVSKEKPKSEPKIQLKTHPAKRFAFIVMLIVFVPAAVYLMATLQFLAFFILAAATFIIIQILNWSFREKEYS